MKKRLLALSVLIFSSTYATPSFADQHVDCTDSSGAWKISFNLEGRLVSNLQFIFSNQVVVNYPTMRAFVHHFNNKTYYDINMDEADFFDFEGVDGTNKYEGGFSIIQNPMGMETNVTCDAT